MQFRKVTASKYIGQHGYTLRQGRDGSFSIFKDNVITNWGTSFNTVSAAERFLDQHDYIRATATSLPISRNDLNFVLDMYGMDEYKPGLYRSETAIYMFQVALKKVNP